LATGNSADADIEEHAMFKITLTVAAIALSALAAVNASAHFLQPCVG
jgi:hypothetical protein